MMGYKTVGGTHTHRAIIKTMAGHDGGIPVEKERVHKSNRTPDSINTIKQEVIPKQHSRTPSTHCY